MRITIICFLSIISNLYAQKQLDLSYYLSQDIIYDQSIPTPASVIGHQVGEWHITHDKLVYYMEALAKSSDVGSHIHIKQII